MLGIEVERKATNYHAFATIIKLMWEATEEKMNNNKIKEYFKRIVKGSCN